MKRIASLAARASASLTVPSLAARAALFQLPVFDCLGHRLGGCGVAPSAP
jgi:hypothetical protein